MTRIPTTLAIVFVGAFNMSIVQREEPGTWSIAAVDFQTGQVGVAGAPCTSNVQGIGEVVPGVGVVVVQGMSSDDARDRGIKYLHSGATAEQIVQEMMDPSFDPEEQQYAVVVMDSTQFPVTYTGPNTDDWHGSSVWKGVAVQGNSLKNSLVVTSSMRAFQTSDGPLTVRLVRALLKGNSMRKKQTPGIESIHPAT